MGAVTGGLAGVPTGGVFIPEYVAGRRVWMDAAMRDLIHKIQHGDPVKGWEGDERLAVYYNGPTEQWELWRQEDDEQMRIVMVSPPGWPLDDRVIDKLLERDRRRRTQSLADEVIGANERRQKAIEDEHSEWVREEFAPRLRHAVSQEAGWGRRWTWGHGD